MAGNGLFTLVLAFGLGGCAVSQGLEPDLTAMGGAAGGPGVAGTGASNGIGGLPGAGGTSSGAGGGSGASVGSGGAPGPSGECEGSLKQIHVLTTLGTPTLYRFDADQISLTEVGKVVCPFSPPLSSFTLSRDGTAWLGATSGQIFKLALDTLDCAQVDYQPKTSGWYQLQLAFVADAPGAKTETLFVVDGPSGSLGTLNPDTLQVTKIGALSPVINQPRITGTGDGKLFTMGFTTPIGEVDKGNAKVKVMKEVDELGGNGGGLGFAQLDGDLFAFRGVGTTVRVGRYSQSTQQLTLLKDVSIGKQALVAGAGASTCAPYQPGN